MPAVKQFLKNAKAIAVVPQNLDPVASAPAKNIHLPGKRAIVKSVLHLGAQARDAVAHVRESRYNPDLCAGRNHPRKLSSTARTSAASTRPSTLISARPGNSI